MGCLNVEPLNGLGLLGAWEDMGGLGTHGSASATLSDPILRHVESFARPGGAAGGDALFRQWVTLRRRLLARGVMARRPRRRRGFRRAPCCQSIRCCR